jgi:WD40 repeat protein
MCRNTHTQPTRRSQLNTDPSVPDLTLQGHVERSDCNTLYYALDCSQHNPLIISGGSDQKICLWSIEDYCSTLLTTSAVDARTATGAIAGTHASGITSATVGSPRSSYVPPTPSKKHIERLLSPRMIFNGHTAQVEEVCFHPRHQELLCSVGDDKQLMIWDMRLGGARAALRIHTSHTDDVNAVHWNAANDNLLVTGSSDHSVKLIDLRRISNTDNFTRRYTSDAAALRQAHTAAGDHGARSIVHTFHGHKGNVTNVQSVLHTTVHMPTDSMSLLYYLLNFPLIVCVVVCLLDGIRMVNTLHQAVMMVIYVSGVSAVSKGYSIHSMELMGMDLSVAAV